MTQKEIPQKPGVYLYTNLVNNKKYIGQAINLRKRFADHYKNYSSKIFIDREIDKYGLENFEFKVLEITDDPMKLEFLEMYYIKKYSTMYPNGYNFKDGGASNAKFDYNIYNFYHVDGNHFRGNIYEFSAKSNIKTDRIKELLRGNCKSYKGWVINKEHLNNKRIQNQAKANKGYKYDFYNIYTQQKEENKTQAEMVNKYPELIATAVSRIIKGEINHYKGWTLEGRKVVKNKDYNKYIKLYNFNTKEIIEGKIGELSQSIELSMTELRKLYNEERIASYNWVLYKNKDKSTNSKNKIRKFIDPQGNIVEETLNEITNKYPDLKRKGLEKLIYKEQNTYKNWVLSE